MKLANITKKIFEGTKGLTEMASKDFDLLSNANSLTKFASLEKGIENLIEKTQDVMEFQEKLNRRLNAEEELVLQTKNDLEEAVKEEALKKGGSNSRTLYKGLREELRSSEYYKTEMRVLEGSFNLSKKEDERLTRSIENYVRSTKQILVKSIKTRDKIYLQFQSEIDKCENVEDLYCVITSIKEEMQLVKTAKKFAGNLGEGAENAYKSLIVERKKQMNAANSSVENSFADESKLELLQPTLMGLFSKAVQRVGNSEFISESSKHVGHLLIKFEDYLIKFNKDNVQDYYIFVEGTPLICSEQLLCSNKEVDDLLGTIGRFWKEI